MEKTLKQLREEVHKDIDKQRRLKDDAIKNFYKVNSNDYEGAVYISSEQLKSLAVGERVKLSDGVEFLKIVETQNKMVFHTMMVNGGKFGDHFHDWVEICKVLEGVLIETSRDGTKGTRIHNVGDRAIYDKGEAHSMHVNEYTLLEVTFLKDII